MIKAEAVAGKCHVNLTGAHEIVTLETLAILTGIYKGMEQCKPARRRWRRECLKLLLSPTRLRNGSKHGKETRVLLDEEAIKQIIQIMAEKAANGEMEEEENESI